MGQKYSDLENFAEKLSQKLTTKDIEDIKKLEEKLKKREISTEVYTNECVNIQDRHYLADMKYYPEVINQDINFTQNSKVVKQIDIELKLPEKQNILKKLNIYMFQGAQDVVNDEDIKKRLAVNIDPNEFNIVKNCGHWIFIEKNKYILDEITRIVNL